MRLAEAPLLLQSKSGIQTYLWHKLILNKFRRTEPRQRAINFFDGLLSYSSVKLITIRDWRLGLLNLVFSLAIIGYILGYVLLFKKSYLIREIPMGQSRITLKAPSAFAPSPYCAQDTGNNDTFYQNITCRYWDERMVVYPSSLGGELFVTTRVSTYIEKLPNDTCSTQLDPGCRYTKDKSTEVHYYTADIEHFTVSIRLARYILFLSYLYY
eukprot:GEZU01025327.1.p1 GENE.GEZU01025327.1~~GEZU01025327.1.p1  ORF type:complete len:212 (-),score=23.47 GEZU01025327.1:45-680(-)